MKSMRSKKIDPINIEIVKFFLSLDDDIRKNVLTRFEDGLNRTEKRSYAKKNEMEKFVFLLEFKNGLKDILREFDSIYNKNDEEIQKMDYSELVEHIDRNDHEASQKYAVHTLWKCTVNEENRKEHFTDFIKSDEFRYMQTKEWKNNEPEKEFEKETEHEIKITKEEPVNEAPTEISADDETETNSQTKTDELIPYDDITKPLTFIGYVENRKTYYNLAVSSQLINGELKELSYSERTSLFPVYGWLNLGIYPKKQSQDFMERLGVDEADENHVECNSIMAVDFYPNELLVNEHQNMLRKIDLQTIFENNNKLKERIRSIESLDIYKIVTPVTEIKDNSDFFSTPIEINEEIKKSQRVLLRSGEHLYGPVVIQEKTSNRVVTSRFVKFDSSVIDEYNVSDCQTVIIEKQDDFKRFDPVHVLIGKLPSVSVKKDILPDKNIIDFINTIDSKDLGDPNAILRIFTESDLLRNVDGEIRQQRIERCRKMLAASEYVSSKTDEFLESIRNDPQKIEDVIGDMIYELSSVRKLVDENKALSAENEKLREKYAEAEKNGSGEDAKTTSIKEKITELKKEKNELSRDINLLREKHRSLEKIENLADAVDILKKEKEKNTEEISALESTIDTLREKISRTVSEGFNEVRLAFDPYVSNELLNSAEKWQNKTEDDKYKITAQQIQSVAPDKHSPAELIRLLSDDIRKFRNYEPNDIFNMYICITQSFLTVFSGKPGTGKTSVCYLLGASLGLGNFGNIGDINANRFIAVSVEKGWSSKRDLIGYYNPLTRKYDRSNARLYDSLMLLDSEKDDSVYPCYVLLDEANLSPMEYYWADFMKLTDAVSYESSINIGGKTELYVPNSLHFLATINNDRTTEQLSPRLIDRSWMITLPDVDIKEDIPDMREYFSKRHISNADLRAAFSGNASGKSFALKETLDSVYSLFESADMSISARIRIAISKYLETAVNIMIPTETASADEIALDYVIVQKLLPKINGRYDDYSKLFEKLGDTAKNHNLSKTEKALKDLKSQAEHNMGYCRYLA